MEAGWGSSQPSQPASQSACQPANPPENPPRNRQHASDKPATSQRANSKQQPPPTPPPAVVLTPAPSNYAHAPNQHFRPSSVTVARPEQTRPALVGCQFTVIIH
ncbi:hypothetical protein EJ05DRAFT_486127 [Pseudovirgaria hyperparasitica]|uniref:Uncharacterized protein n=1 Tax=Pseudovirgaria hyperparasitica TaxID=470096 RepID=A0A6A6W698_9PEZI|nr:uncharacterized protein EJ05DRAFT_486127 [Pseudovirgaria hyperparasitica]KAF2758065.1 hypothetical protein EJ05DRAFT_486127 [Pseudovirgaria hyperparasitica]